MICALELGVANRIEKVRSLAIMSKPNPQIMADNPLSKIPALVTEDGRKLVDSYVICEYLQQLTENEQVIPSAGDARITVLNQHALANNLLDLLILWRNERNKPAERQTPEWLSAFELKTNAALDRLEQQAVSFENQPFDLGQITTAVMLDYMNFRFADDDWSTDRPVLTAWFGDISARASFKETEIVNDE